MASARGPADTVESNITVVGPAPGHRRDVGRFAGMSVALVLAGVFFLGSFDTSRDRRGAEPASPAGAGSAVYPTPGFGGGEQPTPGTQAVGASTTVPEVAAMFGDAYLAGEPTALAEVLARSARIDVDGEEWPMALYLRRASWDAAQGTTFALAGCTRPIAVAEAVRSVACIYEVRRAAQVAASSDATFLRITLTYPEQPFAITRLVEAVSGPGSAPETESFQRWVRRHHPDQQGVAECCRWGDGSADAARVAGEAAAALAAEWQAFLRTHGCSWRDSCEIDRPAALAIARRYLASYWSGDISGWMALQVPDVLVTGTASTLKELVERVGGVDASGALASNCDATPAKEGLVAFWVVCTRAAVDGRDNSPAPYARLGITWDGLVWSDHRFDRDAPAATPSSL